jgi:hypothetical protein
VKMTSCAATKFQYPRAHCGSAEVAGVFMTNEAQNQLRSVFFQGLVGP